MESGWKEVRKLHPLDRHALCVLMHSRAVTMHRDALGYGMPRLSPTCTLTSSFSAQQP